MKLLWIAVVCLLVISTQAAVVINDAPQSVRSRISDALQHRREQTTQDPDEVTTHGKHQNHHDTSGSGYHLCEMSEPIMSKTTCSFLDAVCKAVEALVRVYFGYTSPICDMIF